MLLVSSLAFRKTSASSNQHIKAIRGVRSKHLQPQPTAVMTPPFVPVTVAAIDWSCAFRKRQNVRFISRE